MARRLNTRQRDAKEAEPPPGRGEPSRVAVHDDNHNHTQHEPVREYDQHFDVVEHHYLNNWDDPVEHLRPRHHDQHNDPAEHHDQHAGIDDNDDGILRLVSPALLP